MGLLGLLLFEIGTADFCLTAGFVTLFSLTAVSVQSTVAATPTFQTQGQSAAKTFIGTIMKNGENFVLSDSATKTGYTCPNGPKRYRERDRHCGVGHSLVQDERPTRAVHPEATLVRGSRIRV
jgi:hypothetical protein